MHDIQSVPVLHFTGKMSVGEIGPNKQCSRLKESLLQRLGIGMHGFVCVYIRVHNIIYAYEGYPQNASPTKIKAN